MKKIVPILFLSFLLTTSNLTFVSGASNTTIMIDGNPSDWFGIAPIVTDPIGDVDDDDEDIISCYVTNDGSNLYFMMRVEGSIIPSPVGVPITIYMVFLDVNLDQEPDYMVAAVFEVMEHGMEYMCSIMGPVEPPEPIGFSSAAFSDGVLEFTCPLSMIDFPSTIDMRFQAEVEIPGTDSAPDEGYVTYDVELPIIEADGDTSDWAGIDPIITDPIGDVDDDDEDIVDCYAADDGETLYIRIDIVGEISIDPASPMFAVALDTDSNPFTGISEMDGINIDIGADYLAYWYSMPPMPPMTMLFRIPAPDVGEYIGTVSSQPNEHTIEMAIPLRWIGNPSAIDIVFIASLIPGTDLTDPVRYVVRIPVGGVLVTTSNLNLLAPWIGLAVIIASIATGIIIINRRKA